MKIGLLGFLLGFLLLAGADFAQAGQEPRPQEPTDFALTFQGGDYSFHLKADGTVLLGCGSGEKTKGAQQYNIPPERVTRLIGEIRAIDFFSLKDRYEYEGNELILTCLPYSRITVTLNGKTKTVEDHSDAPVSLQKLEKLIFELTEIRARLYPPSKINGVRTKQGGNQK